MFEALDENYLAITALVSLGWQMLGFAIAYTLQIDTITDFWSAVNVAALALLTYFGGATVESRNERNGAATALAVLWAARLGAFQLFRMLKMGGDTRFDEMRSDLRKFAGFWIFQLIWVWTISLPLTLLNAPAISLLANKHTVAFGNGCDIAGIVMFCVGLIVEAAADLQKYFFKAGNPPRGAIVDAGIWRWSRRPNYFGEILLWWGMFVLSLGAYFTTTNTADTRQLIAGIASPLITMALLLGLSGIPLAERPTQEKFWRMKQEKVELQPHRGPQTEADPWLRMVNFRKRTSLLVPIPPMIYAPIPQWIKRAFLFDWKCYEYNGDSTTAPSSTTTTEKNE